MAQRAQPTRDPIPVVTGVLFTILLAAGFLTGSGSPGAGSSASKVQHYVTTHKGSLNASGVLTVLAVVVGLFFYGYLRDRFRRQPGCEWLASVFFGSAIFFGVGGAINAGTNFAMGDHPGALAPQSLQTLNTLGQDLGWGSIAIGLAVVYLAAALVILRSHTLPVWLAWVSGAFGLLGASFFLVFIPLLGSVPWILVVSALLYRRKAEEEAGVVADQRVSVRAAAGPSERGT